MFSARIKSSRWYNLITPEKWRKTKQERTGCIDVARREVVTSRVFFWWNFRRKGRAVELAFVNESLFFKERHIYCNDLLPLRVVFRRSCRPVEPCKSRVFRALRQIFFANTVLRLACRPTFCLADDICMFVSSCKSNLRLPVNIYPSAAAISKPPVVAWGVFCTLGFLLFFSFPDFT